jgi:hypothetical protein
VTTTTTKTVAASRCWSTASPAASTAVPLSLANREPLTSSVHRAARKAHWDLGIRLSLSRALPEASDRPLLASMCTTSSIVPRIIRFVTTGSRGPSLSDRRAPRSAAQLPCPPAARTISRVRTLASARVTRWLLRQAERRKHPVGKKTGRWETSTRALVTRSPANGHDGARLLRIPMRWQQMAVKTYIARRNQQALPASPKRTGRSHGRQSQLATPSRNQARR